MAFCNSCGSSIDAGAGFCPKCGVAQAGSAPSPTAPPSPAPQKNNAMKTVVIVVGAVVVLGAAAIAAMTVIGLHIARHTRVENHDGNVRVESPFGTIESTNDPDETAHNLGVALYPGAKVSRGNSANVSVGGIHTVAAEFETDDPVAKVADFYKAKFPDAKVSVSGNDQCSIVSKDSKNLITINIDSENGKTVIHIANVSGQGTTDNSRD